MVARYSVEDTQTQGILMCLVHVLICSYASHAHGVDQTSCIVWNFSHSYNVACIVYVQDTTSHMLQMAFSFPGVVQKSFVQSGGQAGAVKEEN